MITAISYSQKPFKVVSQANSHVPTLAKSIDTLQQTKNEFTWLTNPVILSALDELRHVTFDSKDLAYLKNYDIEPPFKSGEDAIKYIKNSNIRINFADTGSDSIHAQYDFSENKISLNKKYQKTSDTADILALSEAILHEACHAKDNDSACSIQEEIVNLATGALAHRFYEKKYPSVFNSSNSLIVKDGVTLYANLFFDNDNEKTALKKRIKQKYGLLPAGDFLHKPTKLAMAIKNDNF